MSHTQATKDRLLAQGWQYKGDCHCGGMKTHKYRLSTHDGDYNLKVRATSFLLSTPTQSYKKYPTIQFKQIIDEIDQTHKTAIPQEAKV